MIQIKRESYAGGPISSCAGKSEGAAREGRAFWIPERTGEVAFSPASPTDSMSWPAPLTVLQAARARLVVMAKRAKSLRTMVDLLVAGRGASLAFGVPGAG
jgi:hypothetical protein